MPLLTGFGQAHHGEILRQAASLADSGKLRPLLNNQQFAATSSTDIEVAHALVRAAPLGKVVIDPLAAATTTRLLPLFSAAHLLSLLPSLSLLPVAV